MLSSAPPLVIDVRRNERFGESPDISCRARCGAIRPASETGRKTLPRAANVVVYCVHGHEVSQNAAKALARAYLEGGIEALARGGGELDGQAGERRHALGDARAAQDRPHRLPLAGTPLHRPGAEFLYVPAADVKRVAEEETAMPYDIADVEFSHDGERCSFDAFLEDVPPAAIRRSTRWRPSCAAPTPAGSISRRRPPGCWRSR